MIRTAVHRPDPQVGNPVDAFGKHQKIIQQFHALQQDVIPVRDHFFPMRLLSLVFGRLHEPEVGCIQVGTNEKAVAYMVYAVLQVALPGLENAEGA